MTAEVDRQLEVISEMVQEALRLLMSGKQREASANIERAFWKLLAVAEAEGVDLSWAKELWDEIGS